MHKFRYAHARQGKYSFLVFKPLFGHKVVSQEGTEFAGTSHLALDVMRQGRPFVFWKLDDDVKVQDGRETKQDAGDL